MANLAKGYKAELKPCPFCGNNYPKIKAKYVAQRDQYRCKILCDVCGVKITTVKDETTEGLRYVIDVWNRRTA